MQEQPLLVNEGVNKNFVSQLKDFCYIIELFQYFSILRRKVDFQFIL